MANTDIVHVSFGLVDFLNNLLSSNETLVVEFRQIILTMDFFTEPLIGKRLNPFFRIALRPQNLTYISLLAAIFIHFGINLSFKIEAFLLAIYFLITIVKKLFLLNFTVHSKLIIQLL